MKVCEMIFVIEALGVKAVAGKRMQFTRFLPPEIIAMRPRTIDFDDEQDWIIEKIMIGNLAVDLDRRKLGLRDDVPFPSAYLISQSVDLGYIKLDTIQTAMEVVIVAVPQKTDLLFRCELIGSGIPA